MKLGALDFLVKPFSREDLLKAVEAGLEQDRLRAQLTRTEADYEQGLAMLSPREREVLQLLVKGFSNAEIMTALAISLPTTKQYKTLVMCKLGARTLSQLMQLNAALRASASKNPTPQQ